LESSGFLLILFFTLENINFLTADGVTFAHPLQHLGKSKKDLPLIAIDSFRHMYLFPKFEVRKH
jgi:endoplasmic reticulum resident protein 44